MKYSAETLKGMAQIVEEDHASGGHRSLMLIIVLARNTGLGTNDVMSKIMEFAA